MLLQLVSANPSLPQSMRDTAQSVAQNAITEATKAIGGQSISTQTVPVPTQPAAANAPTISYFNASASTVTAGQSVTLTWASNAANCYVWRKESNGGYTAIQNNAGSATSLNVIPTTSSTYVLNCYAPDPGTGKDAPSAQKSVYIAVKDSTTAAPTIYYFSASPSSVNAGGAVTLSWSSNAANCHLFYDDYNADTNVGSATTKTVYPTATKTYTLTCVAPDPGTGKDAPSAQKKVTVTVLKSAPTCTLTPTTATPGSYATGYDLSVKPYSSVTLTLASQNASYAVLNGEKQLANFSWTVDNLTSMSNTYEIWVYGDTGSAKCSTKVYVDYKG